MYLVIQTFSVACLAVSSYLWLTLSSAKSLWIFVDSKRSFMWTVRQKKWAALRFLLSWKIFIVINYKQMCYCFTQTGYLVHLKSKDSVHEWHLFCYIVLKHHIHLLAVHVFHHKLYDMEKGKWNNRQANDLWPLSECLFRNVNTLQNYLSY